MELIVKGYSPKMVQILSKQTQEEKEMQEIIEAKTKELMGNRESILNNVLPRLAKKEDLEEIQQKGLAYGQWMDMIVRYYVPLNVDDQFVASVQIGDNIMNMHGISDGELYAAAVANIENLADIGNITQILHAITGEEFDDSMKMYVMTNNARMYGAAQMLSATSLKALEKELGTDQFYIIPSSIHEVIALPIDKDNMTAEALIAMIREVNDTTVDEKDRLSYSVYIYNNGSIEAKGGEG